MFTGIIKSLGEVKAIKNYGSNTDFTITSSLTGELQIDQSIAHNGVCLTVVKIDGDDYVVTAIEETLKKTNLGQLKIGDHVNLERAMIANTRLDGHMVQGHVDATGTCVSIEDRDGSWYFRFKYTQTAEHIVVDKGSVCVNGVSLTVVDPVDDTFSVAIIPYTYEHTTFKDIKVGTEINLEFDIIGKYIARYMKAYQQAGIFK